MRFFMVAFQSLGIQDEVKLKDIFGENGFKFWHRFPTTWIVVTPDEIDALKLQEIIGDEVSFEANYLVVKFETSDIVALVPDTHKPWFEKHIGLEFGTEADEREKK